MKKYSVRYHDERSYPHYRCLQISTANFSKWEEEFVKTNAEYVTILESYTLE